MIIEQTLEGTHLTVELRGRLDAITAPQLEAVANAHLKEVTLLSLDCTELGYISSAGLRVLLSMHKAMMKQGRMVLRNVNEEVLEVFKMTGLAGILTFE